MVHVPRLRRLALGAATGAIILVASVGWADPVLMATVDFDRITGNSPVNIASYISVEVYDPGVSDQVLFKVLLDSSAPSGSFLSDIYFDDGDLIGISSLGDADDEIPVVVFDENPNVDYSPIGATATPQLPGGNSISPEFVTTAGLGADEDNGGPGGPDAKRLNPGEWLGILFNLDPPGKDASDVLAAMDPATFAGGVVATDGTAVDGFLRIGIHAQGLPDGSGDPEESDSFVSNPPVVIPLPSAVCLGLSLLGGMGVIGGIRRKLRGS